MKENSSPAKYLQINITAIGKMIVLDTVGIQFSKLIAICFVIAQLEY